MIQYIQVETDDDGTIVGLGFVDSMTGAYDAVKKVLSETSGLPKEASTKDHISKIKADAWREGTVRKRNELQDILSEHSGLVPVNEVSDHIATIKLKAYDQGYDNGWHDKQADISKRIKLFEEKIREAIRVRDEVYHQSMQVRFVVTKIFSPSGGEDAVVNGIKKDGTTVKGLLLCNLTKTGLHVDDLDSYLEV